MSFFTEIISGWPGLLFVAILWILVRRINNHNLHTPWSFTWCLFFQQCADFLHTPYTVLAKGQLFDSPTGAGLPSASYPPGFIPIVKSNRPDFSAFLSGSASKAGFLLGILFVFSFSTLHAASVSSSAAGGNWSDPSSWVGGMVPGNGDEVVIAAGSKVIINSDVTLSSLSVSGILEYESGAARTLTVTGIVTINSGGVFRSAQSGTIKNHRLIVHGSIINNGTIDFSANANETGVEIVFTGAGNAIFNCSDAPLTNLRGSNGLVLDKGTSAASVLSFNPGNNFRVQSDGSSNAPGFLSIVNGTFNIIGSKSFSNPVFDAAGSFTIPATGGFWLGNQNATVTAMDGTLTNLGDLKMTNGTLQVGKSPEHALKNKANGQFKLTGGTIVVAGGLELEGGNSSISGGALNIASRAKTASAPAFSVSAQARLEIYGDPMITLTFPNSKNVPASDIQILGGSGFKSIKGGTIQLGTADSPVGSTFLVNSAQELDNLDVFDECSIRVMNSSGIDLQQTPVDSLPLIVFDRTAPELTAPPKITLKCGDPVPPVFSSLQEFTSAGGAVSDNCTLLPASFKLSGQVQSSAGCPYTITRTYEVKDNSGNAGTAEHVIVVEGEGPQPESVAESVSTEELKLKSAMATFTAVQTGNWNDPATWSSTVTPSPADNVIIPGPYTVTVNSAASCDNITIDAGATLKFSGTNTLQVNGNLLNNGTISSVGATGKILLYGNWTNNGTYNGDTNGIVEFTGANPASIAGSSTTTFKQFIVNKGALADVVQVASNIQLNGDIVFTRGTLQVNAGVTVNCTHNSGFIIEQPAGLKILGTFNSGAFSIDNKGVFEVAGGTANLGTAVGNSLTIMSTGDFTLSSGQINIAGRLELSGGDAIISGGTLNINTVGNNSASPSFYLSPTSTINMSGGSIVFQKPNGTGNLDMFIESGSKTFTSGNITFGGTAGTYRISSEIYPFPSTIAVAAGANLISKLFVTSSGTYNFPLVNQSGVAIPASVTFSGTPSVGASIQIETTGAKYSPNNKSSVNYLNRFWTVTINGITNPVDVTTAYTVGDIAGTESEIAAGSYVSSWTKFGVVNTTAHTLSVNGITASNFTITGITSDPPTVTASASPNAICLGASSNLTATPVGDSPFTYSWVSNPAGFTFSSATPTVTPVSTTIYTVTVTDGNGFTATDAITVNVNPLPVVTATPSSQTICSGESTNISLSSSVIGTTYTWTVTQTGVSGATNGSGTLIAQTLTATGSTAGTATYNITPTANGCAGTPINVTITVNPLPVVTATPSSQTICSGESTNISLSSSVTGTTYTWTVTQTGVSGATNGSGTLIAQTLTATGITAGTATYNITPTANGCSGTPINVTITVNPLPVVTATPSSQIICSGESTNISLSGSVTGTTYTWTATQTGVSGATNGSGTLIAQTLTATGSTAGTATYNITPTANGCAGTPINVTVTVNPIPTVSATPISQTICPGGSFTISVTNPNSVAGTTFSWVRDNTVILTGVGASGSGASISGVLNSTQPTNTQTTTFTVTATSPAGCSSQTTVTVTVADNTPPTITCPSPITQNSASGSCNASVTVPALTYADNCSVSKLTWTMTGATTASSPATGINEVGTYTFNVGVTTVTYTVNDAAGNPANCAFTVTITDNTPPVISGCPGDITAGTNTRTTCNQVVSWIQPTANDNCSGALTYFTRSHAPGAIFPLGNTLVTYTFRDAGGNSATCTFTVTVFDNTAPTYTGPNAITINTDASCNENRDPSITGSPINPTDNCTPSASLSITYTDGANQSGACTGNYSFTRSWYVTDAAGNTTSRTQVISVQDKVAPLLTIPDDISIQCGTSTGTAVTGLATATDNCGGTVSITFTDVVSGSGCSYTIIRTWRATDPCGNQATGQQSIFISDTTPPVVQAIPVQVITNRNNIPSPNIAVVQATDNCAIQPVIFLEEIVYGLEDKPGYCPDAIEYIYRVSDGCANHVDVVQRIEINDTSPCQKCLSDVPFNIVDFRNNINAVYTFTVKRNSKCCEKTGNTLHCASFNIVLGDDAIGIEILVDNVVPSGQDWDQDCQPLNLDKHGIVCLEPGKFHLFTYCKKGVGDPQLINTYTFRAVPGIVASKDITTRVDCSAQIVAQAEDITNIRWNSIYPGTYGQYNNYLSCTADCLTPTFTADENAPAEIKYQICGSYPGGDFCFSSQNTCDTISVYVKREMNISLNINPDVVCIDNIPEIAPIITPAGTYKLEWFNGHGTVGSPVHTGATFSPTTAGPYSVRVTDMIQGIPCSTINYDFDIVYDLTGPTIQAPPAALTIQCNDPAAQQQIVDWLAQASATYINAQGQLVTATVTHNYAGINMACGNTVTVTFSAVDQCSNSNLATSTITVIDNTKPLINGTLPLATVEGCLPVDAPAGELTVAGMEALGLDISDACTPDANLVVTYADASAGTCPLVITRIYRVTDDCGNYATTTQTIHIDDTTPPSVTGTIPPTTIEGCTAIEVPAAVNTVTALEALGLTISDTCTADAGLTVTSADASAGTCPVVITRTYTISDACGNSTTVTQTISIDDTTPPAITCPGPYYQNANPNTCIAFPVNFGTATVTDNCSTYTVTNDAPAQFPVGVTTITWTATDACGNISTCEQYVTIYDIQPPVIDCTTTVINATVGPGQCDVAVGLITPTYTENCNANGSPTVTVTRSDGLPASANFPVGTTTVGWTVTDIYNNFSTCTQTVNVTDNIAPTIACPADVVATAPTGNCQMLVTPIGPPTVNDNCGTYTLTWTKSGATSGSGIGDVNNTMFNGGVTSVTYTVTDAAGNSASCSFTVTVNDQVPPTITNCPPDVLETALTDLCQFTVTSVPQPTAIDPCGSIVSMTHNSPYATNSSTTDASGIYPVGTTTITWTVTDNAGNIATCVQTVTVTDRQLPELTCPGNETYPADFGVAYKLNVPIDLPTFSDNCPGAWLTWTMGGATTDTSTNTSGFSTVPTPYSQMNVGVTTIIYSITDISGQTVSCSFTITIVSAPEIACAAGITTYTASNNCGSTLDPGIPTLIQGAQPITWTWTIDSPISADVSGISTSTVSDPTPDPIGLFTFDHGTTTITWTATNISGSDACTQIITVIDNIPPVYTPPPTDVEYCVENLFSATYSASDPDLVIINPDPDYYLFETGVNSDTSLDLNVANIDDNCCPGTTTWTITFSPVPNPASPGNTITYPPVSGTGQPSAHPSNIQIWGDGVTFTEIIHEIEYTVTDCHGNSTVFPREITVKPRPKITKMN